MAVFNIDHSASNEQRAYIRHLSTLNLDHLKKAIEQVVDFIWRKVHCSNIRIEIFHLKDEVSGQFKVEVEVKNAFAANAFKWKTLSNDPITGKRA